MADTTATTAPVRATFSDNKDTYEAALRSLFSGRPEDTEADLTRLCAPTFTLKANFEAFDFPGFVKHIRWLRENLPANSVSLTTVQFLRDGRQRAERHIGRTTGIDGVVRLSETYQFAEIAEDGRFAWIDESVHRHNGRDTGKPEGGKPGAEKPETEKQT